MTSRIQILCDDSVKGQIDKLCDNLDLKVSAESRGRVIAYLIGQTKDLVRLRGEYASVVDDRDSAKTKIEELEINIEQLEDEIEDLRSSIKAHQRALVFALDATPK